MNILDVGYRSTRYYLLADGRPRLLIDAGWPDTLPHLRHQCRVMDIRLDEIPYLLCTHYHPDHAGLARELRREGMRLIVTETQVGAFRDWMAGRPDPQTLDLTPDVTMRIADSRTFLRRKLGLDGEIVATPGHSEDSVSLVLDTGEAFIGDLGPDLGSIDADDPTRRSWNALRALGAKTAYPSHGPNRLLEFGGAG